MSIGVVYVAYGTPEFIEPSLKAWLELKQEFNVKIAAVNGQFKENHELGIKDEDSPTQKILVEYRDKGKIDFLYIKNPTNTDDHEIIYETEAQLRTRALKWLLDSGVDYIWIWDADEVATAQELKKAFGFVKRQEFTAWFRTFYKNLVFDERHFIDNFNPPRIYKVNHDGFKINEFTFDNDCSYVNSETNEVVSFNSLAHASVPRNLFFPKHYTWLSDDRSKQKIKFQLKHYGHCSYAWNEKEDKLEFDLGYHKKFNIPIPTVYSE